MFPELCHFALILSLFSAMLMALAPLLPNSLSLSRQSAYSTAALLWFSLIGLSILFINGDFSVLYVANHSSLELPLMYRWCAPWGSHEGSMLLWVVLFASWSAACAFAAKKFRPQDQSLLLAILGAISVGFILFILFTSNPFIRLLPEVPTNGRDLNPLLQDPGFLIHPPMLYMGYVGSGIVYAIAMLILIRGECRREWLLWLKPWSLIAWGFLSLGITLGSWWSYRVLGWGGYWMWDPVENASLLPWISMTAFLHSLLVSIKRNTFHAWTLLLGIISFALSLLGTFLVRSGVLTSVHAFAVDPKRGIFILGFLFIVIATGLLIYALRVNRIINKEGFKLFSRETAILGNNALLMIVLATVLLGTIYPMIIDALNLGKVSVGPPYFNAIVLPMMIPLVFLMGIGPLVSWYFDEKLAKKLQSPLMLSAMCLTLSIVITKTFFLSLAITGSVWLLMSSYLACRENLSWSKVPMLVAHSGFAIMILGLAIHGYYAQEKLVAMHKGDSVMIAGYRIQFQDVTALKGVNYSGKRTHFAVYKNDKKQYQSFSDKRVYSVTQFPMSHPGIITNIFRDLYIAIGDPYTDGRWSVRVYYKPGIRFIWIGGLLLFFSCAPLLRRKRISSGERRHAGV